MEKQLLMVIIGLVGTSLFGLFTFLVKSYFSKINESIAKLEGGLDPLRTDLKENTIELIKIQSDLKLVWKYIENSPIKKIDKRE